MSIGTPEIITCLIIALLVLGPDKMPGFMRTVGRGYAEFKKITGDVQGQIKDFVNEEPEEQATTETAKQARGEASSVDEPTPTEAAKPAGQLGRDLSQMPKSPPVPGGQAGNAPPARHPGTEGFQMIDTNPPVLRTSMDPAPTPVPQPAPEAEVPGDATVTEDDYQPRRQRPAESDEPLQPWRTYGEEGEHRG